MRFRRSRMKLLALVAILAVAGVLYFSKDIAHHVNRGTHPTSLLKSTFLDAHLLTLIFTGPANVERRKAIRETWIRDALDDGVARFFTHKFVIGTKDLDETAMEKLNNEEWNHGDLIFLEDLHDKYENLTFKLGMMLEHVMEYNYQFQFILKVDDDSFVRVKDLWEEVRREDATRLYYMGYFYGRGRVKTKGPWKEPNWKLCDYYLPYARGGGYVISRAVVQYVVKNWRLFETYLSEDVSLGAWLAPLKIRRKHDIRFDTEYKSRGCSNTFIISHKQSVADMYDKSANLRNNRLLCKEVYSLFNGYSYNWQVPPTQCCTREKRFP